MKSDLVLGAPPVVVAGANVFFGYTLPEWAAIVTIVYTIMLAIRLLYREWTEWRARRAARKEAK